QDPTPLQTHGEARGYRSKQKSDDPEAEQRCRLDENRRTDLAIGGRWRGAVAAERHKEVARGPERRKSEYAGKVAQSCADKSRRPGGRGEAERRSGDGQDETRPGQRTSVSNNDIRCTQRVGRPRSPKGSPRCRTAKRQVKN